MWQTGCDDDGTESTAEQHTTALGERDCLRGSPAEDRHWVRVAERRIVSTPSRLRVHSGNRENFRVLARWWLGLERKRERKQEMKKIVHSR